MRMVSGYNMHCNCLIVLIAKQPFTGISNANKPNIEDFLGQSRPPPMIDAGLSVIARQLW